jgi:putative endonuclease
MSFWVYILQCSDGSYYTGHTDNLETRIAQHQEGSVPGCHTYTRRPLQCVFSQAFSIREEALSSERQIKGWSRKKKEAMIRGDWPEVSRLARPQTKAPAERVTASPVPDPARSASAPTTPTVCPEPVEGPLTPNPKHPVRPEPVEGHFPSAAHPNHLFRPRQRPEQKGSR